MTLEEMIMNEIDRIPIQKQTDLQKNMLTYFAKKNIIDLMQFIKNKEQINGKKPMKN